MSPHYHQHTTRQPLLVLLLVGRAASCCLTLGANWTIAEMQALHLDVVDLSFKLFHALFSEINYLTTFKCNTWLSLNLAL